MPPLDDQLIHYLGAESRWPPPGLDAAIQRFEPERRDAFTAKLHEARRGREATFPIPVSLGRYLVQTGQTLTGKLESLARTYLAEDHPDRGELRDLLIQLPRRQVDGWLAKLRTSKVAKSRRLAAEYDAKLAAS